MVLRQEITVGTCIASGIGQQVRETWTEAVAIVLALLLAVSRDKNGE